VRTGDFATSQSAASAFSGFGDETLCDSAPSAIRPHKSVILCGRANDLSARVLRLLTDGGNPVSRATTPEDLPHLRWSGSRPSRAVLFVNLPTAGGRELRSFRRQLAEQTFVLARAMRSRASVLIVADPCSEVGEPGLGRGLQPMLCRMRAAAEQELASTVTVNAVVLSGRLDETKVAFRIWEAVHGTALPDSGYVVNDDDLDERSIAALMTEARS
jgi:hypothetical protein